MTVACARVERGSRSGKTVGLPLLAFMGPLSRFFGGGYERNLARFWNRAYCVSDDLSEQKALQKPTVEIAGFGDSNHNRLR